MPPIKCRIFAKLGNIPDLVNIHDLAKTIQGNKSIHAAILDFSKAFDKVPHQRPLRKLEYHGIRENLLKYSTIQYNNLYLVSPN